MEYQDLLYFLQHVGTDPSRLIFEDELTGIYNRRFLLNYFRYKVPWDALEGHPVSLLMMDLDDFKRINDTYGHDTGDQVLIWVASLIKEVSGDEGLAIRYAGDEFIVLMPQADKEAALQIAERLIQRLHDEPLRLAELDEELRITFSVGVASAPDDAQTSKALIQKADTALYHAKKTGRDRLADAGQVSLEDVFAKTALHQLDKATIAGRKSQLFRVAEALKKFSKRQSQFLIVEGASGMGKSEFLQAIRRNLAQTKIWQISANGSSQEGFSPYYLTTNILIEILNQRPDKGAEILDNLTPQEVSYLSHVLPQLGKPEEVSEQEAEKTQREQIFTTLVHFIPELLSSRPLILLIDDLHFSDEATLLLLRQLLLRGDIPLFICGTASDIQQSRGQGQAVPLERFFAAYREELSIGRVALTSLTGTDIGSHFRGIFPQVRLPENFEENLAQLTQGNPLFISEIQRKLVLDGKITLTGQQWIIEPLEEGYLPRSLEEIVSQKIAALDEESRQLLDQASTIGENVSLSVLTGSSENRESEVLEFIDQAVAQGLISTDYQMNDDTISFLSKRVLEITYGAINEERKQELHERVGDYQETLYEQRLLPSAATLAYHFQLSTNREKARLYQESQQTHSHKMFNAKEARYYTGEKWDDTVLEDSPLDPSSLPHIPEVIRALLTTVRNIKLYPPGSKAIVSTTQQLKETIDKILANNDRLSITISGSTLVVNGEEIDLSGFKPIAETYMKFMNGLELKGIAFSQELGEHELWAMVEALGRISKKMIDRRFWKRFAAEQRLLHIELRQVRYTTTMAEPDEAREDQELAQENGRAAPVHDSAKMLAADHGLDEQDLNQIPQVLRSLLTAASNIKLYPPESTAITQGIEQFYQALKAVFARRPALTFARIGESLLVNGQKIDTADFKTMADGFLRFLKSVRLRSLSFLKDTSVRELAIFIGIIGHNPAEGFDSMFWRRFAREQQLSGILFDQRLYGILEEQVGAGAGELEPIETAIAEEDFEPEPPTPQPGGDLEPGIVAAQKQEVTISEEVSLQHDDIELTETSLESMAEQLSDLLLKGDEKKSEQIIHQLFENFAGQPPLLRTRLISVCDSLLEDPVFGSQPALVELLTDPLLLILPQEEDAVILRELAALLSRTAANLIQFGDYQQASRILTHVRKRQSKLQESSNEQAQPSELVLIHELEPRTQMVLLEDLRSQDPTRLQSVARLLSSLGSVAMPLLIEVIKREDNLRVRQIAAHLLKEAGPEAARLLKRELVLEGITKERVRILEVIDGVTQDLQTELAHTLGDDNPKVRQAAFRLTERLNDPRMTSLLFDYANHEDSKMAVVAIKSLGKLKPKGAVDVLVSVLESSKEIGRLIACCRALGQIADPAAIEPLAKMLAPGGLLSLRKKRSSLVRATAASALAQIPDPRVAEVLAPCVEDRDPRVRQVARGLVNK
jgi:diguanylate cyclase (GGDEF)-like protein